MKSVRSGNALVTGVITSQTRKVMKEVLMRPLYLFSSLIHCRCADRRATGYGWLNRQPRRLTKLNATQKA